MFKLLNPITAAFVFSVASAAVAAATAKAPVVDPSPPSVSVSGADLDLASTSGQQEMRRRVGNAASDVCEMAVPQRYLRLTRPPSVQVCKRDTRAAAEPRLAVLFARAASGERVAIIELRLGRVAR